MKNDGGKGSKPRPFSVTQEEYSKRWDMIFARDLKDEDSSKDDQNDDGSEPISGYVKQE